MRLLQIKVFCEKKQLDIKKLAERIDMSEQNLHRCIRNNKIDAGVLEKISQVLDVPIISFFDVINIDNGNLTNVRGNNNVLVGGDNNGTINKLSACEREVEHLKSIIVEKERLIQVLMKNSK